MKKMVTLVITLALLFSLAVVGQAEGGKTFGYIWFDIENEWEQYNFACFKDGAERCGVNVVEVMTDVGDPAKALSGAGRGCAGCFHHHAGTGCCDCRTGECGRHSDYLYECCTGRR